MPQEIYELFEAGQFLSGMRVDRAAAMLRDVALLGAMSQNGRKYSAQAMSQAAKLYEGASFYVDHPTETENRDRRGVRSVRDLAGKVLNVRMAEKVRGDIQLIKGTPMTEQLLAIAEQMPEKVGNSHRVLGVMGKPENGVDVVDSIERVYGIELVTDPATTRGLFESQSQKPEEVKHMTLEELKTQHPQLVAALLSEVTGAEEAKAIKEQLAQLTGTIKAKDTEIDNLKTAQKISEHKALVAAKLAEAKLPERAVSEQFKKLLEEAKDEAAVDALIKDRKELVGISAPTKKMIQPEKSEKLYEQEGVREVTDKDVAAFVTRAFN